MSAKGDIMAAKRISSKSNKFCRNMGKEISNYAHGCARTGYLISRIDRMNNHTTNSNIKKSTIKNTKPKKRFGQRVILNIALVYLTSGIWLIPMIFIMINEYKIQQGKRK